MSRKLNGQLTEQLAALPQTSTLTQSTHDEQRAACELEERFRMLQAQLMEKERLAAIGTTAAKLAHEIGNPLNGMSLAIQLLELRLGELREDGTVLHSVKVLKSQTLRLANLLHEFSALSRCQRLTLRPTNLVDLVHEVLTVEVPLYTQHGIAVEQLVEPDLPVLYVDRDKLKQVVLNLCKNAVEAMPDGGTLTVGVHNLGQHVHLAITDTGEGILDHIDIFEPFVTTKNEGSGLGLPIVQQIVAAHGGMLTYTSTPSKGTTFVVVLPLQRENLSPSNAPLHGRTMNAELLSWSLPLSLTTVRG